MSFTDDALKAKLSALNETQEGIVTVSQWVIFHRRYAERIAQLWLQKLRDSPAPKRLNLIYLANEVTQQSKARRKEDFVNAFSPIIAEAMTIAYKGSSNEIQQKLRRVVEVWRQRSIFELPIQEAVEARVDEIDRSRSTGKKPLGGSFFASSSGPATPAELQPLVPLQVALSKSVMTAGASATTANAEYDKMHDPNYPQPTPPVLAARLSQLLKTLANAESSVSESIKSRHALIEELEKLLEANRSALSKEHSTVARLSERKAETEAKKREVEDAIMKGLSAENFGDNHLNESGKEADPVPRPAVEGLTPPPVEAITPVGSPKPEAQDLNTSAFAHDSHRLDAGNSFGLPGFGQAGNFALPGTNLSTLAASLSNPQFNSTNGTGSKKRKVSHEEEDYAKFAGGDLDADVAELLAQEGSQK
ncbi:hypothetical protein MPDQ_008149 [Monascus purpureus]|uniref:CID domain-containing protein n=1 Tax=Monascus purpureus TaxID=5098 RepID=A0A507QUK9_MONPU|nr:hypothetical protein MPDQ_008149 [Monascus purpureus]BDD57997.1 hypothetical protein MAP00_003309 [Monascus purpureus]